jgi:predicted transcriptional regulator
MNYNQALDTIDETKGAIKYILVLSDPETERLERLQLIEKMKENNISRDKFYKITTALSHLNIITEEATQPDGRIKKVHTTLTPKGKRIAQHLNQIKTILEE